MRTFTDDLTEPGYLALLLAICKEMSADDALRAVGEEVSPGRNTTPRRPRLPRAERAKETAAMVARREEGATYKEIAEEFNITISSLHTRLSRWKKGKV